MTDNVFQELTLLKTHGLTLQVQQQNMSILKIFIMHHNSDSQRHGPLTRYCFQEDFPLFENIKKWKDMKKSKHQKWYWCGTRVSKQQYDAKTQQLQMYLVNTISIDDLATIIFDYGSWIPISHGHDLL
jgi:hypothetical protein